jgi:hypothetical protein
MNQGGRRSRAPTRDFTVAFGHGHPLVIIVTKSNFEHGTRGRAIRYKRSPLDIRVGPVKVVL